MELYTNFKNPLATADKWGKQKYDLLFFRISLLAEIQANIYFNQIEIIVLF